MTDDELLTALSGPDQSVKGLIAWLKTQDPTTTFNPASPNDCIWTRYGRSQGFPQFQASSIFPLISQAAVAFATTKDQEDFLVSTYAGSLAVAERLVAEGTYTL